MNRTLLGRVCGGFGVFLTVMTLLAGAQAAVVVQDLGELDLGDSGSFLQFTSDSPRLLAGEIIGFEVNEPAQIDVSATRINLFKFVPLFGISNFGVSLVRGTGPDDNEFSSISAPLATGVLFDGALVLSYAGLVNEVDYGLVFTGTITGILGGLYTGAFSISAVPLPPSVWLFLSAILGLVGVVRMRRKAMIPAALPQTRKPNSRRPSERTVRVVPQVAARHAVKA